MDAPHYHVIAWVTMDGIRLTGLHTDRLQQVREVDAAPLAKALVWISGPEATAAEIQRAKDYAAANKALYLTFPESEEAPLNKARAIVLAKFANKELEAVP